ncbi:ABC transporter substrate-binding protein [Verminephrobacter eiseniae]|uniref:ABC transporter substrate-binding protein n=1 Tax=Verminephrobacter eiseniae TaxID=364317 RepID=UPI0022374EAA|nr:ABC transporter substrate-binding protein [Verminephrobacter eiseniae]MCW5234969.1 ABC transporter substrate-binding protein [Verminephrobacter eiseniae]
MKSMWFGVLSATAILAGAGSAFAQQKTLYVAGYGGSFEQMMRKEVIPDFEKQARLRIEYVAGNSTDTLAKLQAQKGNQQIDAIIVDDGPAYQAVALGFCGTLHPAPIYADVAPVMKFKSNQAVGLGMVATGLFYNKKVFAENRWPAPTSWADLNDPKFRKKLVIPSINNTYGLHTLVAMAQLGGGSEANVEPGFKMIKEQTNPNVLVYESSSAKMVELFQSGQAVLGVWGSGRVKAFADTGFPAEFVYPREGSFVLGIVGCPVDGSKNAVEANAFLQYMLSPAVQMTLALRHGSGPANTRVVLTPQQSRGLPYGGQARALKALDWDTANAQREEWTRRWNREIER